MLVVVVAGAVVVVAAGAVVGVAPGAVVVVATGAWSPASTCSSALIVVPGGFGRLVPSGANPTVISWRFTNLRSAGFGVVAPPV